MMKKNLTSPFAKFFGAKKNIQNEKFNEWQTSNKGTEELRKKAIALIKAHEQKQRKENSPFSKFLK